MKPSEVKLYDPLYEKSEEKKDEVQTKRLENPISGNFEPYSSGQKWAFEAGADALLTYFIDSGIITVSELEVLNKNGNDKRKPE